MITLEFNDWHAWQGTTNVLLSDESNKRLREFPAFDDAITWLYVNGHTLAARAFNNQLKAQTNDN